MAKKIEVIIGEKYGRLKVIQDAGIQKGRRYVTCLCDCGNIKDMPLCRIKGGKIISCGCYNKEVVRKMMKTHGLSKTRLYGIYRSMKSRCYNKKNADYPNYGGRGIRVCDKWLDDYMNFHQWALNNGYSECLSIDRIDVNGNYEPQNCRWVSQKEQCNNLRKNVRIKYQGYEGTISEVAEKLKIPYTTLYMRLFRERYKKEKV